MPILPFALKLLYFLCACDTVIQGENVVSHLVFAKRYRQLCLHYYVSLVVALFHIIGIYVKDLNFGIYYLAFLATARQTIAIHVVVTKGRNIVAFDHHAAVVAEVSYVAKAIAGGVVMLGSDVLVEAVVAALVEAAKYAIALAIELVLAVVNVARILFTTVLAPAVNVPVIAAIGSQLLAAEYAVSVLTLKVIGAYVVGLGHNLKGYSVIKIVIPTNGNEGESDVELILVEAHLFRCVNNSRLREGDVAAVAPRSNCNSKLLKIDKRKLLAPLVYKGDSVDKFILVAEVTEVVADDVGVIVAVKVARILKNDRSACAVCVLKSADRTNVALVLPIPGPLVAVGLGIISRHIAADQTGLCANAGLSTGRGDNLGIGEVHASSAGFGILFTLFRGFKRFGNLTNAAEVVVTGYA